jgi:hypothetical protein
MGFKPIVYVCGDSVFLAMISPRIARVARARWLPDAVAFSRLTTHRGETALLIIQGDERARVETFAGFAATFLPSLYRVGVVSANRIEFANELLNDGLINKVCYEELGIQSIIDLIEKSMSDGIDLRQRPDKVGDLSGRVEPREADSQESPAGKPRDGA